MLKFKSESIENLAKSLSKFQAEVTNPANTANNPFYKSKYAPLNEVLNTVRPVLAKYGLSVIQSTSSSADSVSVTTALLHDSGEWIKLEPLYLKADKNNAQGFGSAITYGRRYTLSAALGISSEDDDDGNSASNVDKKQTKKVDSPETETELQSILKLIDTLAKSKAKENRDGVTKAIKAHHKSANYNSIKDLEVAKKVLEALENL